VRWNVRYLSVKASIYLSVKVSVYPSVIVAKFYNCFATLCEIPTGHRLSVLLSMIVAKIGIFF